jgi:hypothetical protein
MMVILLGEDKKKGKSLYFKKTIAKNLNVSLMRKKIQKS